MPLSLEQWAIRSLSAGFHLTVVTVSSDPQRFEKDEIGLVREGSQRWTAASLEAVTNFESDQ